MNEQEKLAATIRLAEGVMGFTVQHRANGNIIATGPYGDDDYRLYLYRKEGYPNVFGEWKPFERINDAWMLVEVLCDSLWECAIHVGHGGMKVYAGFVRGDVEVGGYENAAPEAVCRAALAVLDAEVKR